MKLLYSSYRMHKDNKLSPAYVAGIVDGEGCIGLYFYKKRRYIVPTVRVVNTNKEIIEKLQEQYGGGIHITASDGIRKEKYDWWLGGLKKIKDFLSEIYPYLIIKKIQAEKVINYCRYRLDGKYNKRYTPEDFMVIEQLRFYNRKGV